MSEGRRIFIVRGDCGEYSDHREWLVRAFVAEDHAQDFANECQRLVTEANVGDLDDPWRWTHPLDPSFEHSYTGTRYVVIPCPYTDGAWREQHIPAGALI